MHRKHSLTYQLVPILVGTGLFIACAGGVESSPGLDTPLGTPSSPLPIGSGSSAAPTASSGADTREPTPAGSLTSAAPSASVTLGPEAVKCEGPDTVASKRIVRLSFNQVTNSIGSLIDPSLTSKLALDNAILDSKHRAFPPLQSAREGNTITDGQWGTIDAIAGESAQYVTKNFEKITGCATANTDDACAQRYLNKFSAKAYRRPLTVDEQARATALYVSMKQDAGASIQEAVQYSVEAILQSPQFLYRTELGNDWKVDGAVTQYELASSLAYFLTDNLPDDALLAAAAQNALSTPEQVGAQIDRILLTPTARKNLEDAMLSYFNYQGLELVVIQDDSFNSRAMYHEGELFLANTLWTGALNDLLLSRKSYINDRLAEVYGISTFPQPGSTTDADGFSAVDLPEDRAGLLTMPGFLSTRSRPTNTSVVGRGLLIKNAVLCTETPSPSESLASAIAAIGAAQADQTEREKSVFRTSTPVCAECHLTFDAYGLALENFDLIGRHRTLDETGRPIDSSVQLPTQIGGGSAANMVEVARQITQTDVFSKCMARNLINYALADMSAGSSEITSCSAQRAQDVYDSMPVKSFSSLIKAVAVSASFANRTQGLNEASLPAPDLSQGNGI
jgi:cytochrome c553